LTTPATRRLCGMAALIAAAQARNVCEGERRNFDVADHPKASERDIHVVVCIFRRYLEKTRREPRAQRSLPMLHAGGASGSLLVVCQPLGPTTLMPTRMTIDIRHPKWLNEN
jgi:hypothetical protein